MHGKDAPRLLLIAGTGRNSGKTAFACAVIRHFKEERNLVAFKISPHRHRLLAGGKVIVNDHDLYILEETPPWTGKDSSRLLEAGAGRSFFVVAGDARLPLAWETIRNLGGDDAYFVGESGGLRRYIKPGLFVMVRHSDMINHRPDPYHLQELADYCFDFDGENLLDKLNKINITRQGWEIGN